LRQILSIIKNLRTGDFRILTSVELGMRNHLYVPFPTVVSISNYTKEDVKFFLSRVLKYNLLDERKGQIPSYKLNERGYDCLALNVLIKADIIEGFGNKLGVGKEADVYDVLLANSKERAALKLHRAGKTSFHHLKRYRLYVADKRHLTWLYASRLAAEREYEALKILYEGGLQVPRPIFHNRHVIVMSFIDGVLLAEIINLKKPEKLLNKILDFIYISYMDYNIIHSDLSEFNIMLTDEKNFLIFDFPQWISNEHPQYIYYLKRDIINILNFFSRKFKIKTNPNEIFEKFGI